MRHSPVVRVAGALLFAFSAVLSSAVLAQPDTNEQDEAKQHNTKRVSTSSKSKRRVA